MSPALWRLIRRQGLPTAGGWSCAARHPPGPSVRQERFDDIDPAGNKLFRLEPAVSLA
jgi:hypothetical protein